MSKKLFSAMMALGLLALMFASVSAATFDSATGEGFASKGEVQSAFGWNNSALQRNAGDVSFEYQVTETVEWTCSRPHPTQDREIVQERSTVTTTSGLVDHIERERNQITGFILSGYDGSASTTTDGPAVGSCPANPSGYTYDDNAESTGSEGGLYAVHGGTRVLLSQ